MATRQLVLLLMVIAQLAGCATQVQRAKESEGQTAYFSSQGRLANEVTLSLSKEARAQLPDNLRFDQNKLLAMIQRTLDAKGLLAAKPESSLPRIEVLITDIRIRSNFAAVMWGVFAGTDSIKGDVIVRAPTGKELQRFTISASYGLGGLVGGQDDTRMGWLYETFAEQTLEELTARKRE